MGSLMESGVRAYEISVHVDAGSLLQNGLSMPLVSRAISAWMDDLPSRVLKTDEGNINVRTVGVDVQSESIEGIILRADPDGSLLTVGDIATVQERYVDTDLIQRFNGLPG